MAYEPMTNYDTGDVIPEVAWDRFQNNIQWLYDYIIPPGVWLPYGGSVLPAGRWLWCDGQAVSRTTYSDLFSVCGTVFGSGDGSTTFNVPDMRGRTWIGMDDMPGGAGAATITVNDADGADSAGLSPRFQVGQLLKIENEYLHVIAVNPTANTVSVIRGVRGTTAVSHAQGTAIYVYAPPQDVQALCLRWAAWLYQQVDAAIGAGADWLYPPDLPPDVRTLAAPFRRVRAA